MQLSYIVPSERTDDWMTCLKNALNCAILAPAGQQRSRMLATLFKDERARNLDTWDMLEAT